MPTRWRNTMILALGVLAAGAAVGQAPVANPGTQWQASVGAAYTRAEDGSRILLTPFALDASLTRNTSVKVEGDGFGRITQDGEVLRGFNNVTLTLSQVLHRDTQQRLRIGAGLTIPARGELGSRNTRQIALVSYTRALQPHWEAGVSAKLTRRSGTLREDAGRVEQSGRIKLLYLPDADASTRQAVERSVLLELMREHRRGAGGYTEATVGCEWPVGPSWGAGLRLSRGLTTGLRDTTLALDWIVVF